MTLSEIVSVTGMPGLYKTSGKRSDGLIVTSLVDGTTKFVSGRVHLFSTLDNITIYTQEGTVELKQVLADMKKNEAAHSPANLKSDDELKAYFAAVVPDYDKEKFYTSHMKKLVGWYNILNGKDLIAELTSDEVKKDDTAETATEGDAEKAPAKKAKADKADKSTKPLKEIKSRGAEKPAKGTSKAAGGGARKTVTPRKAS